METALARSVMHLETFSGFPLLSLLVVLPGIFAILGAFLPADAHRLHRALALTGSILTFVISLFVWARFNTALAGFQLVDDFAWIPSLGARWTLGVDGISLPLVMLTTLLQVLILLSSFSGIETRVREFGIAIMALEAGILGALLSVDLLLFYVFWEIMLVPMYLLIGVWGGQDRIYAAVKFFLFTMAGSLLMLVAIIWLYLKTGSKSFALPAMLDLQIDPKAQLFLFAAFALAFAIKVPLFPLHTWLPDAHVEAPTSGSIVLAGVLLKLGTYGFMRFAIPLFPAAMGSMSPLILALACIGVVYGALMAYVQKDIKKLVAYSSVSHLGFVVLGLVAFNEEAVQGAVLQGVNHGLSTGALFFLVGCVYERRHTRLIADYGGIAKVMPAYALFAVLITMSSVGLPLTNGFVGEFLILSGSFREGIQSVIAPNSGNWRNLLLGFSAVATTGLILGAVYMLQMIRRVFFGPLTNAENEKLRDLGWREKGILAVFTVFILWIGVLPGGLLKRSEASVRGLVQRSQMGIMQVRAPANYARELRLRAVAQPTAPARGHGHDHDHE